MVKKNVENMELILVFLTHARGMKKRSGRKSLMEIMSNKPKEERKRK